MKPNRPYRALRAALGAIAVLALIGVWIHSYTVGEPLDPLWQLAALIVIFAGAVAVFGKGTFETATETAKDIGGESDGEGDN